MFRRLFRLIRVLLPAFIVAAAWLGWWILPERPLREWRLSGPFGLTEVGIDVSDAQAVFSTIPGLPIPSPYYPAELLAHYREKRYQQRRSIDSYVKGPGEVWQVDLATGTFTQLAHDHPIKTGIGDLQFGPELTWAQDNSQLSILDGATKELILRIPCWPNPMIDTPTMSQDRCWLAVGEAHRGVPDDWLYYLAQRFGVYDQRSTQIHLRVYDAQTGKKTNDVPAWALVRWVPGTDQFWTVDTLYSFRGEPKGVTVRLWSVFAAPPPWWLWSLSVAGVAWYVHRICRWRCRRAS